MSKAQKWASGVTVVFFIICAVYFAVNRQNDTDVAATVETSAETVAASTTEKVTEQSGVPTTNVTEQTEPPQVAQTVPPITALDGTVLEAPVTTQQNIPPGTTISVDEPGTRPETPSTTTTILSTPTDAITLEYPLEHAEAFVREYWTVHETESPETWQERVGLYATMSVRRKLSYPAESEVSSEVTITPLTEINGTIDELWAEFNIVANVTRIENGERLETIPLPMYVFVRNEGDGWIVTNYSFNTI